jgi:hypothetical protein
MFHVASFSELTSSYFGYRYCFSIWRKLLAGIASMTEIEIKRAILEELNIYQERTFKKSLSHDGEEGLESGVCLNAVMVQGF